MSFQFAPLTQLEVQGPSFTKVVGVFSDILWIHSESQNTYERIRGCNRFTDLPYTGRPIPWTFSNIFSRGDFRPTVAMHHLKILWCNLCIFELSSSLSHAILARKKPEPTLCSTASDCTTWFPHDAALKTCNACMHYKLLYCIIVSLKRTAWLPITMAFEIDIWYPLYIRMSCTHMYITVTFCTKGTRDLLQWSSGAWPQVQNVKRKARLLISIYIP